MRAKIFSEKSLWNNNNRKLYRRRASHGYYSQLLWPSIIHALTPNTVHIPHFPKGGNPTTTPVPPSNSKSRISRNCTIMSRSIFSRSRNSYLQFSMDLPLKENGTYARYHNETFFFKGKLLAIATVKVPLH